MKNGYRNRSIALFVLLVTLGCTRAGATNAHARAIKPAPASEAPDSASVGRSDSTPRVWELTALADRKGPPIAS
jgi:hypothetical protein